jgi:hypothetical protein
MWSLLPKPQKRIVISRYKQCADTPPVATAAVMAVDIALLIFQNIFLFPCGTRSSRYSLCSYSYGGGRFVSYSVE